MYSLSQGQASRSSCQATCAKQSQANSSKSWGCSIISVFFFVGPSVDVLEMRLPRLRIRWNRSCQGPFHDTEVRFALYFRQLGHVVIVLPWMQGRALHRLVLWVPRGSGTCQENGWKQTGSLKRPQFYDCNAEDLATLRPLLASQPGWLDPVSYGAPGWRAQLSIKSLMRPSFGLTSTRSASPWFLSFFPCPGSRRFWPYLPHVGVRWRDVQHWQPRKSHEHAG